MERVFGCKCFIVVDRTEKKSIRAMKHNFTGNGIPGIVLGLTKDYKSFMVMTLKDRKLNNRNDIITIEEILDLEDYYRLEDNLSNAESV